MTFPDIPRHCTPLAGGARRCPALALSTTLFFIVSSVRVTQTVWGAFFLSPACSSAHKEGATAPTRGCHGVVGAPPRHPPAASHPGRDGAYFSPLPRGGETRRTGEQKNE